MSTVLPTPVKRSTRNLAELLWDAADNRGHHTAILERDRATTYAELRDRTAKIAGELRQLGIRPGDRVAIMLERGSDAVAAFFGAAALGAIAININEASRPRQIEHVLDHSEAAILITSADILGHLHRPLATKSVVVDVSDLRGRAVEPVSMGERDPVQISYTSGSTGSPKGVLLSHDNLLAVTRSVVGYLELTPDDRIASLLPLSFVYGFNQLLCSIGCAGTLLIERSPFAQQIVTTLREQEATVVAAVPSLWGQLLHVSSFSSEPLPALRLTTNAGGALAPELVRRIRQAQPHARLILMYGLTEALRSTYVPSDEVDAHPDAIGRPVPGAEIMVVGEDLGICAPGQIGELVQRGPTVALGYWRDPQSTAAVFRPYPLGSPDAPGRERVVFSGDLVRYDEDGLHYFVGRRDHMIKTLGYRVSPDEICAVLHASGLVTQAAVASAPCAVRGQKIVAAIVLVHGATLEQVERYCRLELPRYMQPAAYDLRESLPTLSNGKLDLSTIHAEIRAAIPPSA